MKDPRILDSLTHGMYVLTANGGGCVVDAVSQISIGDHPLVSVAVMKKNYTNELIKKNGTFALSILGTNTDSSVIPTFGFKSMRETNKFEKADVTQILGLNVIKGALGYLICEKVDEIDNDTHTLFIGRVVECDVTNAGEPMSYGYYREHKEELTKVKTESGKTAWVCTVCGYVYYGDELPADYVCPICGVGADLFEKKSDD